jgi:hypothetical protein
MNVSTSSRWSWGTRRTDGIRWTAQPRTEPPISTRWWAKALVATAILFASTGALAAPAAAARPYVECASTDAVDDGQVGYEPPPFG